MSSEDNVMLLLENVPRKTLSLRLTESSADVTTSTADEEDVVTSENSCIGFTCVADETSVQLMNLGSRPTGDSTEPEDSITRLTSSLRLRDGVE